MLVVMYGDAARFYDVIHRARGRDPRAEAGLVIGEARRRAPTAATLLDLVYAWCMSRTNIDLDDEACETVMERYHFSSKREAVNYALRLVASEALELDAARALRGSGWEGDLDEVRGSRTA